MKSVDQFPQKIGYGIICITASAIMDMVALAVILESPDRSMLTLFVLLALITGGVLALSVGVETLIKAHKENGSHED